MELARISPRKKIARYFTQKVKAFSLRKAEVSLTSSTTAFRPVTRSTKRQVQIAAMGIITELLRKSKKSRMDMPSGLIPLHSHHKLSRVVFSYSGFFIYRCSRKDSSRAQSYDGAPARDRNQLHDKTLLYLRVWFQPIHSFSTAASGGPRQGYSYS